MWKQAAASGPPVKGATLFIIGASPGTDGTAEPCSSHEVSVCIIIGNRKGTEAVNIPASASRGPVLSSELVSQNCVSLTSALQ